MYSIVYRQCMCMCTHARTTLGELKNTLFTLYITLFTQSQTLHYWYSLLQSLKVSIGIKGIQIRLQQLKAEGVLLLSRKGRKDEGLRLNDVSIHQL